MVLQTLNPKRSTSEALMTIFSTFLKGHLKNFDAVLQEEQFAHKLIQVHCTPLVCRNGFARALETHF